MRILRFAPKSRSWIFELNFFGLVVNLKEGHQRWNPVSQIDNPTDAEKRSRVAGNQRRDGTVSPRESDREKRRGRGHAMAIMELPRSNEGPPATCRVGARVGAPVAATRESNIAARL